MYSELALNVLFNSFMILLHVLLGSCRHGLNCSWRLNLERLFDSVYILFFLSFWGRVRSLFLPWGCICPCNSQQCCSSMRRKSVICRQHFTLQGKGHFFCNVISTCLFLSLLWIWPQHTARCVSLSPHSASSHLPQQVKWGIIYGGKRI